MTKYGYCGVVPVERRLIKMRTRILIHLLLETFAVLEKASHLPNDLDECFLIFAASDTADEEQRVFQLTLQHRLSPDPSYLDLLERILTKQNRSKVAYTCFQSRDH